MLFNIDFDDIQKQSKDIVVSKIGIHISEIGPPFKSTDSGIGRMNHSKATYRLPDPK